MTQQVTQHGNDDGCRAAGRAAAKRVVSMGDRIAGEQIVQCWTCRYCLAGADWMCAVHDMFGLKGFDLPWRSLCCAHRSATSDFDELNWHTRRYGRGSGGYEQSKLADLLFTLELHRRLDRSGSPVIATAAHS
ncbi:alcohol dehydrogenase catalytic domain-containing protein [Arthrobacter sp. zg-Y1219]|uniref:alcohol dehydrogenase catalytic domain-containing protein n=1 Tax=Arthrobacter sp. zg-Y1219 TaxID=3049067 RepID=UPI0024C282F8|nr:alcohol dehydrogenase catalytic domain-containing protein [Arthrobacter sp. zg-Y1219]MDK1361912.1 alcohol dehydrogenase catalytic domain-containing protein [Arthrobacter sp. zg-Y1219]